MKKLPVSPPISLFDRDRLHIRPLAEREHLLDLSCILPLSPCLPAAGGFMEVAKSIRKARDQGSAVVLMMGAHVLRSGVQKYLIDMMEQGYLNGIAVNGAVIIHDYEFSLIGATTESVARYIRTGQFGLWQETGRINDIVTQAAQNGEGLGEAVGKVIEEESFPHRNISILAAAYRLGIPVTAHIGIGYDITHEHPNFDGASYGATSYRDFLKLVSIVERLEDGVVMNFGSAVMGPEIFLKALAMARNAAFQEKKEIRRFVTLVCDLADLPETYQKEPCRSNPKYYFRPWKTLLARTVSDGGESFYVQGDHRETVPQLWTAITKSS